MRNSGQDCRSQGCPSQAVESAIGNDSFPRPSTSPATTTPQCLSHARAKRRLQNNPQLHRPGAIPGKAWPLTRAGNLYGATAAGGDSGAGLVYELSPKGQDWLFVPLYSFTGEADGVGPMPNSRPKWDPLWYGERRPAKLQRKGLRPGFQPETVANRLPHRLVRLDGKRALSFQRRYRWMGSG